MTITHPVAVILDILADAGVNPAKLHDAQRQIAAAYSEANEGISAGESAPRGER